ncbi:uncharacterized protein LOC111682761 [Lucilia cuprina]|uniref:uncharacterized protein LOC111682761 n=1 Tax=Lucilia cuprina TaxID=7375 RepID=UPI001F060F31|nr:uncharacterized protein LOC111682761 [Lucilia cuprina]
MDIKTLLLKSLSSKKPIRASRRIIYRKLCFYYKICGKRKNVVYQKYKTPNCKIKTWAEHIKHYRTNLKRYRKKKNIMEDNLAISKDINFEDKATTTIEIPRHIQAIQTEIALKPLITKTKSTQSEIVKSTNTDDNTRNSNTQTDLFIDMINSDKTSEPLCWRTSTRDFDVVIYMLNEIGEIVINQNQLLSSNSEMIKEIVERNSMTDSKTLKSDSRSITTQTDEPVECVKSDNASQTVTNVIKSRKLLCLKGKISSSQHKKPIDMKKS